MATTIITSAITTLLGILIGFLIKKSNSIVKGEKAERTALKMLLQSNLTNVYYVHNELGQIEDYKLKNWFNELKAYEDLGGDDYIHVIAGKMKELRVIRTNILQPK